MQNVSLSYLEKIKEPSRSFECRVTIGNNVYTNIDIINISIEDVQPSDGFTIGAAVSKSLELTLSTNNTIYSNSKVKLEIGLNIGSTLEYILIGNFHIEDIISTDYSTKLTCYDNMIKFEKPYFSNLGKTSTLKNIVNELATITGVEFTGSLPSYNLNKLEGFTCRDVLGFVASICGGNAYITREGKFTIKTPATIDYSITSDNYIDLKSEEDLYKVGAITCKANDKELTKGTLSNSSMEITFENPWVTESILTEIYNKLKGFEFIGYSMKWQGDFSLDVGDIISITDTKGNTRQVPIFSQKLTYNGGLTSEIGAKGESKTKNEFSPTGDLNNRVNRVVTDLLIVNKALINKADIEDLKAVNAEIENLIAVNVTITGKLSAIEGEFGTIKSDVATIGNLTVTHTAQINDLKANSATITQLDAVSAKIGTVEADVGKINTLLAGNITGENIQSGGITSDKLTIANGFITNAMIANLDVSKVNAGDISTNKFRIKSDNGGIEIVGATQQFKDKNNRVRIQMGQDAKGNFNFIIRGEDGTTTLIDHNGIKEKAIADDLIKSEMISSDAVGEKQINYSSFITGFNKDTNTNTIKSTKIMLNNQNQTLDVAFSSLKTQADGTKSLTESHSTTIGVMQGQISTAINNTQIVKDGQTILLKDDYNRTVAAVDSMKSTIGQHSTKIDEATGKITGVETRVNTVERNLEGTKSIVSSNSSQISNLNSKISAQGSEITQLKTQISLKVEQADINKAINNLEIGVTNLVDFTDFRTDKYISKWKVFNSTTNTIEYSDKLKCIRVYSNTFESDKPVGVYIPNYIKLEAGQEYTLSLSAKSGAWTSLLDYCYIINYDEGGSNQKIGSITIHASDADLDIVRSFVTFTPDVTINQAKLLIGCKDSDVHTNKKGFYIKNIKLEKGNKSTAWTTSNNDLDYEFSITNNKVSEVVANLEGVTQRVRHVEQTQTSQGDNISNLTNRVQSAESKLTKSGLTTIIGNSYTTKTDVEGQIISKGYATESYVNQSSKDVVMKFTESGGVNLLRNSSFKKGLNNWTVYNTSAGKLTPYVYNGKNAVRVCSTITSSTPLKIGIVYNTKELNIIANKWYTLSFKMRSYYNTNASDINYLYILHDDGNEKIYRTNATQKSIGGGYYQVTVPFQITNTRLNAKLLIGTEYASTTANNEGFGIMDIALCEGQVGTGWTPHPDEVYDGITAIDKDGITVTSSNVRSKTTMSADGFKITKTDTNEDVFKVNSDGRLSLIGYFTSYSGNRKSGYFGSDQIKFYNWWADTNEEIAYFYGGKTSDNKRSADIVGRDMFSVGVGTPTSGSKVLEGSSSKLFIYKDTDFGNYKISNLNGINEGTSKDIWLGNTFLRSNQLNTNIESGILNLNYWKGYNSTGSVEVKVGNGNNDSARGNLTCQNFKAYGTKNACVQTSIGYVDINAYETCDYYFGDIGETILDSEGYSYVYIDSIFSETVNTQRKYQVFLSIYGEGTANVVKRTPIYFVIKGTPGIEVGYEIKAKRKGYEDYRLERDINPWRKGEEHGLDEDYNNERIEFNRKIENIINEEVIKDIENKTLQEFISSEVERSIENIELMKTIEEDIFNENIN